MSRRCESYFERVLEGDDLRCIKPEDDSQKSQIFYDIILRIRSKHCTTQGRIMHIVNTSNGKEQGALQLLKFCIIYLE